MYIYTTRSAALCYSAMTTTTGAAGATCWKCCTATTVSPRIIPATTGTAAFSCHSKLCVCIFCRRCRGPTGPATAHQIINTSEAPLRYLAISPRADAEVCEYPDSGKIGAYGKHDDGFSFLAPASAGVDYFDGEDDEP